MERRPTERAWAKLGNDQALPLPDHGGDVAAMMAALLDAGWARRLGQANDGRPLDEDDRTLLVALAFVHDLGKTNRGFWERQFPNRERIGHTTDVLTLWQLDEAAARLQRLDSLLSRAGENLFMATLAHHGAPLDEPGSGERWDRVWRAADGYDPITELFALLEIAADLYPSAFRTDIRASALGPRAISLYAGLLTLADWLGSDEKRFPIDGVTDEERRRRSEREAAATVAQLGLGAGAELRRTADESSFAGVFGVPTPYPTQSRVAADGFGSIVILEAETGSGKTEAAFWRFLSLFARGEVEGLYFALPTRTSAIQIHTRIQRWLDRTFGENAVAAVLAVPGYLRAGHVEGRRGEGFDTLWPDDERDVREDARWAAESSKRYLSARVAIGTVDQVLLSGLRVRHAHLRAAALSRSLLVIDEVHASDRYMSAVLGHVLDNHRAAGGHALLLSATLGASARVRFLEGSHTTTPSLSEAVATDYPAIHGSAGPERCDGNGFPKPVDVTLLPVMADPGRIAALALEAARSDARVLIVRNTVADAVATLEALEALDNHADLSRYLFRIGSVSTLHHGRFAAGDRRLLDDAVERAIGKDRHAVEGRIVIGTQTLEMSLDLDADLLITDLAPVDVLLQRFGRLHRHRRTNRPAAFTTARATVLTPADRDLSKFNGRLPAGHRHGLGPTDGAGGGIYANLESIEATWRLFENTPAIYIPTDNRELVERGTHPDVLEAIARELGWETSAWAREGAELQTENIAHGHALSTDTPFAELHPFPRDEHSPRTRLGADDWRLVLDEPFEGPFGEPVDVLRIPGWMLRRRSTGDRALGTPLDAEMTVTVRDGGASLEIGGHEFIYDRLGLRSRR